MYAALKWIGQAMLKTVWGAVKYVARALVGGSAWAAAHPLLGITAAAAAAASSAWLDGQDWAGARIVKALVGAFGVAFTSGALTGFLVGKTLGSIVAPAVFSPAAIMLAMPDAMAWKWGVAVGAPVLDVWGVLSNLWD